MADPLTLDTSLEAVAERLQKMTPEEKDRVRAWLDKEAADDYKPGDMVEVSDGARKLKGIVTGKNPNNAAEYEIRNLGNDPTTLGGIYFVHWAYLKLLRAF